ncbi:hypothetical protein CBR_g30792 [Chara braunii]|uniref:Uncharacterized protein n=1 Tax=Chara braunii TaxID=69332 RepID=A0A388JXC8_CHABU|nr:hypothetical protein CBR_g30792 [Chara braunii]|eukprot:GBG62471.1 hypothetical protein CBR_g30792 [Chara braunii]
MGNRVQEDVETVHFSGELGIGKGSRGVEEGTGTGRGALRREDVLEAMNWEADRVGSDLKVSMDDLASRRAVRSSLTKKKADDPSKAIAEMMLQGWAMMNEHCPECVAPLLRNRKKRLFCAVCERWMFPETDMAAAPSGGGAQQQQQQTRRELDSGDQGVDSSPPFSRITHPLGLIAEPGQSLLEGGTRAGSLGGKESDGTSLSNRYSATASVSSLKGMGTRDGAAAPASAKEGGTPTRSEEKRQARSLDEDHHDGTTTDAGDRPRQLAAADSRRIQERICNAEAIDTVGGRDERVGKSGRVLKRMAVGEPAVIGNGDDCRDGHAIDARASDGDRGTGLGFQDARHAVEWVGQRSTCLTGSRLADCGPRDEDSLISPTELPLTKGRGISAGGRDTSGGDIPQANGALKIEDVVSRTVTTLAHKLEETRKLIAGECSVEETRKLLGLIVEYANVIMLLQSLRS